MTPFRGVSAFPITPADSHGRVDTAALRVLLGRLTAAGVNSIGLLGSTGTYVYLSRAERRRAVEAAVDQVAGATPVVVGIGALRTDEAIGLGQDAKACGADAVLLAPVSYTPLTDDEVFEHYAAVAEAVGLPLCVYNNPGTTHFNFSLELLARLSRLPNVVAVKNPSPEVDAMHAEMLALRSATRDGFSLGSSVDWRAMEALRAGADCWYSVAAGLFPIPCMEMFAAVRAGDHAEASRLDRRLKPLWDLFVEFSSLRVMYAAADLLGLCHAPPPRPLLPLGPAVRARIGETLDLLELR